MKENVLTTVFGPKQQKKSMKGPSWVVNIGPFLLEIVAVGLAIRAMTLRSKANIGLTLVDVYCQYSSDVATRLAAGAAVLLFLGHSIIMGVTGCFCCGSGSYCKGRFGAWAIVYFLLAWILFLTAEFCLIAGAVMNKVHTRTHVRSIDTRSLTCQEVREWVFAAGAVFTFLTLVFGENYYLAHVEARNQGLPSVETPMDLPFVEKSDETDTNYKRRSLERHISRSRLMSPRNLRLIYFFCTASFCSAVVFFSQANHYCNLVPYYYPVFWPNNVSQKYTEIGGDVIGRMFEIKDCFR